MKANRKRLDKAKFFQRKLGAIEAIGWNGDELGERAIALHPEGLIELAGIGSTAPARCALATTRVRRDGDDGTRRPLRMIRIQVGNRGGDLMAEDAWIRDQR